MAKKKLAEVEATVDELRQKHRAMIARRMTGPGDSEAAMHRLEQEFGLPYWSQWDLQNKRERIPPSTFMRRLQEALVMLAVKTIRTELKHLENEALRGNVAPDLESLRTEAEALLAKIDAARMKA